VLDQLLHEEAEMSRGKQREEAIITSANYDMKLIAREAVGGIPCDVVELIPKRKSPYLLKGRMWVKAADVTVVRIEGQAAANLSFFVRRPQIVRDYKQIDGFALAQRSHATSGNFFLGQSTVDIDYRNYHVTAASR
jgi:hypothetical protein